MSAWNPERRAAQRERLVLQRATGAFEQLRRAGRERMEGNPLIVAKRREVGLAAARKLNTDPAIVERKVVAVTATLERLNSSPEFRQRSAVRCRKLIDRRSKITREGALQPKDIVALIHYGLQEDCR